MFGAIWTAGRYGNALSFDGVDDRVEYGAWSVAGTALTLTAWIRLYPEGEDNDARILSKATGMGEPDHWWMLSTTLSGSDRRLRARLKAGGSTVTLIASSHNLPLDTWTHVAATYDGATLRLCVNGNEAGSVAKTGHLAESASAPIWIGANPPDAYAPLRGLVDDVRVYNVAMDAAGVAAIMNDAPPQPRPGFLDFVPAGRAGWTVIASGAIGHFLYLQRATNLLAPQWQRVATQALTSSPAVLVDTALLDRAFYRLLLD